jgi:hypothetical protein
MINNMNKILKASLVCLLGVMMAASLVFATPASTVYAESPVDDPQPPTSDERDGTLFIERVYQRTIRISEHVGKDYDRVSKITERINNVIARLNEHAKDTAPLEEALDTFETSVVLGQPELQKANDILAAHDGFDGSGKVTNREAARQTLKGAREALKNAHQTFHESVRSLIESIRGYRANLQPAVTPDPSTT